MKTLRERLAENLFMAWAIASKDIVDVLKSKGTRTNVVLMFVLVLVGAFYANTRPTLTHTDLVVYDARTAPTTSFTEDSFTGSEFIFHRASSLPELEELISIQGMELGLVIPADFDQTLQTGAEATLTGYLPWARRFKATRLESEYAQQMTELLGGQVRIEIGDNTVQPAPGATGPVMTAASNLTIAIFVVAVLLVPHLILEEKQTRTMEALLVSPAGTGQVVAGKALAGLFYVALSVGATLAFTWSFVTNWGLALLALVCGVPLAIGIGLALGSFFRSPQQLVLWSFPIMLLILIPATFGLEPRLMPSLKAVLGWLPSAALTELFRASFSSGAARREVAMHLVSVLATAGLVYALIIWKIRRSDR
jgi:ABC-2 type transport system permease protein